jgi:hypothetical protein
MRTLALAAVAALALTASVPEPAVADLARVCATANGTVRWVPRAKCRKSEKTMTIERPMGAPTDGTATADFDRQGTCAELATLKEDEIALCVGHDEHVGTGNNDAYGPHCFAWLETTIPLQRLLPTSERFDPKLGCDEVAGNCKGDPNSSRFIITWVDRDQVAGVKYGDSQQFISEDAYVVTVENYLIIWDDKGCRAVGRLSGRSR